MPATDTMIEYICSNNKSANPTNPRQFTEINPHFITFVDFRKKKLSIYIIFMNAASIQRKLNIYVMNDFKNHLQ